MKQDKKKSSQHEPGCWGGAICICSFQGFHNHTTMSPLLLGWIAKFYSGKQTRLTTNTFKHKISGRKKTRSIDRIFILSELLFGRFPSASCRYLYGYSRGRIGQRAALCADYAWLRNIRNGCTLISKCFNHKNNPRVCTSQHYRVDGRDDTRVQVLLPFVLQFGCNGFQRLPFRFTASKIMSGSR